MFSLLLPSLLLQAFQQLPHALRVNNTFRTHLSFHFKN
jgi:hypothetical protein